MFWRSKIILNLLDVQTAQNIENSISFFIQIMLKYNNKFSIFIQIMLPLSDYQSDGESPHTSHK